MPDFDEPDPTAPAVTYRHRLLLDTLRAAAGSTSVPQSPTPDIEPESTQGLSGTGLPLFLSTMSESTPVRVDLALSDSLLAEAQAIGARYAVSEAHVVLAAVLASLSRYVVDLDLVIDLQWPRLGRSRPLFWPISLGGHSLESLLPEIVHSLRLHTTPGPATPHATVVSVKDTEGTGPDDAAQSTSGVRDYLETHADALLLIIDTLGKTLTASYNPRRHAAVSVTRFLCHCERMLSSMVSSPTVAVCCLDVSSEEDTNEALSINSGAQRLAGTEDLATLLADTIARNPDRLALCDAHNQLTYRETAARVDELAGMLDTMPLPDEALVAVILPRDDLRWVLACLAIVTRGHVLLPLESSAPPGRLDELLDQAQPAALITDAMLAARHAAGPWRLLNVDNVPQTHSADSHSVHPSRISARRAIYCMFTSGSTGRPRGVVVD